MLDPKLCLLLHSKESWASDACNVEEDTGADKAERCMCALKADAPGGDRAFLEC